LPYIKHNHLIICENVASSRFTQLIMPRFEVRQTGKLNLTSYSGLALIGQCCQAAQVEAVIDPRLPVSQGMRTSDVVKSMVGLLSLGKSDFEAIEPFREDRFFKEALGLTKIPSSAWMRQRLDARGAELRELTDELSLRLLERTEAPITAHQGYVCCDIDTFVMDQSDSAKEGVSYTYAGVDGYCPIALYLGTRGYCLELDLRAGSQHSARESEYNIERALGSACAVAQAPLLLRADSGFCSQHLMARTLEQAAKLGRAVDLLIKWNPRSAPVEQIAAQRCADVSTVWNPLRAGKRECLWSEALPAVQVPQGGSRTLRRVYRLTERTLDKRGQPLLFPEYVLEGWSTTLGPEVTHEQVITLYRDHATHEQFHAEFKTDMDLNRLPSGKFATNHLVCALAAVAMNLLRIVGQYTLHESDSPMRKVALRRRIKTVMQELMYKAARVISHARGWALGISGSDSGFAVFERAFGKMKAA